MKESSSGQALLVVLLTMTVVLTVVLSIVSRSVTEITITSYGEEAQRAFDAAEAGIEQALLVGSPSSGDFGDATYDVNVDYPSPSGGEMVYPIDILSGESATFWFVSHDTSSGDLECAVGDCIRSNRINEICWGEGPLSGDDSPAIEVSIYYDASEGDAVDSNNFSSVGISRITFDPYTTRLASNSFLPASTNCSSDIAGQDFAFSTGTINYVDFSPPVPCASTRKCLLMAKVRMFYSPDAEPIGLDISTQGSDGLPAQGTLIDSLGEAGETTRRVNVFESFPEPPFIFDSAIYSAGDIIKL